MNYEAAKSSFLSTDITFLASKYQNPVHLVITQRIK